MTVARRRCAQGHDNRVAARFCAHCGEPLATAPQDGARPPSRRPSLGPHTYEAMRARLWPPAALLGALTLLNLLLAIGGATRDAMPPRLVIAGLLASTLITAFAWPDRAALAPLLRPAGLRASHLLSVVPAGLALYGFMTLYTLALAPFGVRFMDGDGGLLAEGWPLWGVLWVYALQPALFEELAFRGYLLGRLDGVLGRGEALLLQAALFAIVHMLPLMFISHFVMGLLLGLLRRRSGSLYAPMLLHAAWNGFVTLS